MLSQHIHFELCKYFYSFDRATGKLISIKFSNIWFKISFSMLRNEMMIIIYRIGYWHAFVLQLQLIQIKFIVLFVPLHLCTQFKKAHLRIVFEFCVWLNILMELLSTFNILSPNIWSFQSNFLDRFLQYFIMFCLIFDLTEKLLLILSYVWLVKSLCSVEFFEYNSNATSTFITVIRYKSEAYFI